MTTNANDVLMKCASCKRMVSSKKLDKQGGYCGNCLNKNGLSQTNGQAPTTTDVKMKCAGCKRMIFSKRLAKQGGYCGSCLNKRNLPLINVPIAILEVDIHTSKVYCSRCGKSGKQETLQRYSGVCRNCYLFTNNPKNINKPPSPRQPCVGCSEVYLLSTLNTKDGYCGYCVNKRRKAQSVVPPVIMSDVSNQALDISSIPHLPSLVSTNA